MSGGRIEKAAQRYLVRTVNQFGTLDEMRNLLIKVDDNVPVRLKDIATVTQGYKEREGIVRVDGREAIELAIYKEGDANTVSVAEVRQRHRRDCSSDSLPNRRQARRRSTISRSSSSSLDDVRNDALIGGVLAVLIIFFFLGRRLEHVHHRAVAAGVADRDVLLHGRGCTFRST